MQTMIIKNFNNKLNCNSFIHIAPAPEAKILESKLPIGIKISELATKGPVSLSGLNSAAAVPALNFEAEIIDLARFKLKDLSSLITFPATGMDREKFLEYWKDQNPNAQQSDELIIYIIKKVN